MYGQYSYERADRLTKLEMMPYRAVKAKKAGHNRIVWHDANGDRHFRLIHTDIMTAHADGRVTIRTGGWNTMTTRRAIAQAAVALNLPFRLTVWGDKKSGKANVLHTHNDWNNPIRFDSEVTLTSDGRLP